MRYCTQCGTKLQEGAKFCPQCGQRLMGSNLEDKQRAIPKPESPLMQSSTLRAGQHGLRPIQTYVPKSEAPLREGSWFERHLNWTMVLAGLSTYAISFILVFLVMLLDPYASGVALYVILVIANLAVVIVVGRWVLKKKNRSMWWLLISGTIFFLFIENHSFMRDRYGRAVADYDKLIELDPNNADTYYKRGDSYYERDEYNKAIADYSKAIQLNPNYADAYYSRGCAYGEANECDKAIADYNKAIDLNPSDSFAYYDRGLAHGERGEVPKAVSDLEKCIELSTDPDLTKDARQALSEIKSSNKRAK